MAKIKQEDNSIKDNTSEQKIAQLQKDIKELRVLLDQQSNQLEKQQKWMQLIQFSWLTFFFVVFNLIFVGIFLALFMKDKGELS